MSSTRNCSFRWGYVGVPVQTLACLLLSCKLNRSAFVSRALKDMLTTWTSRVSGKDVIGEAVLTGGEPHTAGFRSDKESGQWNSDVIKMMVILDACT